MAKKASPDEPLLTREEFFAARARGKLVQRRECGDTSGKIIDVAHAIPHRAYAEHRERWIGRVDWLPTGAPIRT